MFGSHLNELITRNSISPSPQPFSFSPSQNWDGNDGAWSTFVIRIGTPSQSFRVLPSLSSSFTYVPLPLNCSDAVSNCGNARGVEPFKSPSTAVSINVSVLDPGFTCSANRGPSCENCVSIEGKCTTGPCAGEYCCGGVPGACNSAGCNGVSGICTQAYIGCPCTGDDYDAANSTKGPGAANPVAALGFWGAQSSTWNAIGNYTNQTDDLPASFRAPGDDSFGMDVVGLGPTPGAGLDVNQTTIVAGAPIEPFFLGSLGLQPSNSSELNKTSSSLLTLLKSEGLIPSVSYGYTAGAIYREQGILGSLTLGGYDSSRFIPNDLTFSITTSPKLEAGLRSITASNTLTGTIALLPSNITIAIDSELPFLHLPKSACPIFESAFGLSWIRSLNLYQLNASVHGKLRKSNPTLTFQFGNTATDSMNITVPYQAFDLQTTAPITANGSNYFPLQCSNNASEFTLGRAFLQEAYILADYEAGNFSISQADFSGKEAAIVSINHAASTNSSNPGSQSSATGHSLGKGAIAGIAIGASIAALLLASFLFLFLRKHRSRKGTAQMRGMSASMPSDNGKESWPSSPTSSAKVNSNPPNGTSMTMTSDSVSPLQRFEERLERLERERAGATQPPELDNNNSWARDVSASKSIGNPSQELPGSATAAEMAARSARGSRVNSSEPLETKPRTPAKHIFELAGDEQTRQTRRGR